MTNEQAYQFGYDDGLNPRRQYSTHFMAYVDPDGVYHEHPFGAEYDRGYQIGLAEYKNKLIIA